MEFYSIFKRVIGLHSPRMKLLLLAGARICGMRYYGVFIDPVIACNLRCKMCYFSDPNNRPAPEGKMTAEYINTLKSGVLTKALKMQVGCGAEPTLYPYLPDLIKAGKDSGIPYIELTTNGQLLTEESLRKVISAGLDGMTLSLHGTTKETYEYLMGGARFDRLLDLIETIRKLKATYTKFKFRINYTVNNLNKAELSRLWTLFDGVKIDVLQVRPIQKLGDTAYNDFSIEDYDDFMNNIINPLQQECISHGTIGLLPSRENVTRVNRKTSTVTAIMEEVSYCYISPGSCYRQDFNPQTETIRQYQHRSGITSHLHKAIFGSGLLDEDKDINSTKKLNYS